MKLKVKVVTEETCKAAMEPPPSSYNITESVICAGGMEDQDTCQAQFSTLIGPHPSTLIG